MVYDTAGKLFADFEAVKFGGDQRDLTRKYLDCDLLIIDDLGTEMTTQFTQSVPLPGAQRPAAGKSLHHCLHQSGDALLRQRYTPAIVSRLLGAFEACVFLGRISVSSAIDACFAPRRGMLRTIREDYHV